MGRRARTQEERDQLEKQTEMHIRISDSLVRKIDARRGKVTRKDLVIKAIEIYLEQPVQED